MAPNIHDQRDHGRGRLYKIFPCEGICKEKKKHHPPASGTILLGHEDKMEIALDFFSGLLGQSVSRKVKLNFEAIGYSLAADLLTQLACYFPLYALASYMVYTTTSGVPTAVQGGVYAVVAAECSIGQNSVHIEDEPTTFSRGGPFLVQLETKPDRTKVLKLDQLPAMLQKVIGADVLVFNTGHWWTHTGKLRAWDHLERNGMLVKMEGEEAFSRALRTWARWVDHNVDQTRTRVFFRSVSPEHKGANWCYNQTAPIAADEAIVPWFPKSMVSIVEGSIRSMRTPATYLNITRLSELRIDAHPSVYSINRDGKPLSLEQRRRPVVYADCSHWCLPGLPDTWNVLLLASLTRYPSSNVHL
ncbi:protein trichome birefringence-like 1 [Triticum dicoccoides]|uniref:protein trichome birefringence-like 1 n=1 Tax=Triticum dicoccoides TaxID=85692 RepID=UPI00189014F8|nr:protein trichome birefringence-like 1 [Triticum dicoccoides]